MKWDLRFGHPPGLATLFFTQTWEQFSYYGMRSILVYYMTTDLAMSQGSSSLVFGSYVALVYFTPIFGGVICDRYLGRTRSVIIGGATMAFGHFTLAFEPFFYAGLGLIALGNGLFLPAVPSQIGSLYAQDDPRRSAGFTIYYVGVNIGGFAAPFACGTLGELYGWHWGFGAAGLGMLAGLIFYVVGRRHLPPDAPTRVSETARSGTPLSTYKGVVALMLGIGLAVTIFRGAYQQLGNTVALWLESGVDRGIGSLTIPMTWFQSLNPMFVFLITPFLLVYWGRQSESGREVSAIRRMATGAALVGGSYLLLALLTADSGGAPLSTGWVLGFFALITLGELYILPVGLYLFDRLAPPGRSAQAVAAWYFTIFTGSLLSGVLGTLWSRIGDAAYFLVLAGAAFVGGAILLALDRPLRMPVPKAPAAEGVP